jgi:hypothetical protein
MEKDTVLETKPLKMLSGVLSKYITIPTDELLREIKEEEEL